MSRPNGRPYKLEIVAPDKDSPGNFELVPTTGSDISSRNAARHGINSDAILPGEAHAFYAHARGMFDSFHPQGHAESYLVARISLLTWRLNRAISYEAAEVKKLFSVNASGLLNRMTTLNEDISSELGYLRTHEVSAEQREASLAFVNELRTERDATLEQLSQVERLALLPEAVSRKLPRYEGMLSRALSAAINDLRKLQADRATN